MEKINQNDKMAILPVKGLMVQMGVPIILSMIMQAAYNIVDSIFVGNMAENGQEALNALTLAFPLQMLMVAIGIGTGVGVNALLSRTLGEGDKEKASRIAGNGIFLCIIIYIAFLLFGLFGVNAYIESQTSNVLIAQMAVEYLQICCVFSFGIVFFSIFEKLLQATGKSLFSTISQISGAVINIILDPVLIFGFDMGVKGAAYATIAGQIASALMGFIFHIKANKQISKKIKYIAPSASVICGIYKIGLPAIIAQALMSFMTYGINIILGNITVSGVEKFGENMVTAYGLFYKIQQFVLFAAFGLRDAITPIISFGYGMKSVERIKDGIKYGLIYTIFIMAAGLIIVEVFAYSFSSMFGLSGETQQMCISAMRIISFSFICAGANIAFQGIYQALDGGFESLIISLCRQFVFVLPVAWGLSLPVNSIDNSWIVWLVFPIAELVSTVIGIILLKRIYSKKVKSIDL